MSTYHLATPSQEPSLLHTSSDDYFASCNQLLRRGLVSVWGLICHMQGDDIFGDFELSVGPSGVKDEAFYIYMNHGSGS